MSKKELKRYHPNVRKIEQNLLPGDIIATSGKSAMSRGIQAGTLSIPNFGPLGRWGWAGFSHVGIVANVLGKPIVYESTSMGRPPCLRTNRPNPNGVQAHYMQDILDGGGDVWHLPLRWPLNADDSEQLTAKLEQFLMTPYDMLGAFRSGGYLFRTVQAMVHRENLDLIFCSELVVRALVHVGRIRTANAGAWSPERLARHVRREGVTEYGYCISSDDSCYRGRFCPVPKNV